MRKLQFCEHCGFCRSVCPFLEASNMEESVGPRGRKTLFLLLLEGKVQPTPRLAQKFYMCGVCKACAVKCPQGIDISEISVRARHIIINSNALNPFMKKVAESLVKGVENGDIFGAVSAKTNWAENLNLSKNSEVVLFASCMDTSMAYGEFLINVLEKFGWAENTLMSLSGLVQKPVINKLFDAILERKSDFYRKSLVSVVELLNKLNVKFSYLGDEEPCCGAALHTYGLLDEFTEHTKKVYKLLKEKGTRRLIFHNPICGGIFKHEYPSYVDGWDIEVKHVLEVIAEAIEKNGINLRLPEPTKVVFHDPCYLARFMDVVEEPRIVLKTIENLELIEPPNNKRETKCCGGGGVELIYRDVATRVAINRVSELNTGNPDIISSCCPVCALLIKKGIKNLKLNARYVDIVDLVNKSLNIKSF
ncbi:MAG: (Fe-S)-binding protein [Aigarchaeota archaeon]|nr:(Fe-S)-binding protein [Aigarchaeota archaeon]